MSTIAKYVEISMKKCFAYKTSGAMYILDTLLYCLDVWVFWYSLMELDFQIAGWTEGDIKIFMGYALISKAIRNMAVGAYDIERHIAEGTLDLYLVRPGNPVLHMMLERPNFLSILLTFAIGFIWILIQISWTALPYALVGILVCVAANWILNFFEILLFEMAFWLKKVDSLVDLYDAVVSVSEYPIVFVGKKLLFYFTYIVPVVFVGTVPTEITMKEMKPDTFLIMVLLLAVMSALTAGVWKLGRRRYESTN